MKKNIKVTLSVVGVIAFFLAVFVLLNLLVSPKYTEDDMVGGTMICQYYREDKNHDVIFIGDCETYANFDPDRDAIST